MTDEENEKFDYEGYTKSLEKILDGATKDYWASYIDVVRHQINVGKNYLWVSVVLLGAYVAAYNKFSSQLLICPIQLLTGIIAVACSCVAFGLCLYGIPARKGYKTIPTSGWGEFSREAYNLLKENNQQVYATFLTSYISKVDNAFEYNFNTNKNRAKFLRITSWLLIASILMAAVVASSAMLENMAKSNLKSGVIKMTDTNQNQETSTTTAQKLQVPEPPPPADINKSSSTHVVDSAAHLTESNKPK